MADGLILFQFRLTTSSFSDKERNRIKVDFPSSLALSTVEKTNGFPSIDNSCFNVAFSSIDSTISG